MLAAQHRPTCAAVEEVFVNINPRSTLLLGQARGAAICGLVVHGMPVFEYTALQLKQAIVGYGHASKRQVQEMVMQLLRLNGLPRADAADALGIAICHAHSMTALGTLASLAPEIARRGQRSRRGRLLS
jgi:crossover junction endodeoxyribonuclease RuvC